MNDFFDVSRPVFRVGPYISIARPGHWSKNAFLLPGVLLAYSLDPQHWRVGQLGSVLLGLVCACLVSSGNYVLNELLDADTDVFHPIKQRRAVPSGAIDPRLAYAEWLLLLGAGLALGFAVNPGLGWAAVLLAVMGTLYNLPPFRLKDRAYIDTLSESINNPIRLAMGWYATGHRALPPLSAFAAYWMFGGLLMVMKRFAEYRAIGDPPRAARYRKSFAQWDEAGLRTGALVFGALFVVLSVHFAIVYRPALLLAAPVVAWAVAHYVRLGMRPDSPVQHPESLVWQPRLMALVFAAFVACVILMFVRIPFLARLVAWYPGAGS